MVLGVSSAMAGEDVLQRIVDLINSVEQDVSTPGLLKLNESLSRYLLQRLIETRKFLETVAVCKSKNRISKPLEELYRIVSEAKSNVQECCSSDWIPAAILQAENKEAFFEVLKELHWCTGVVITATRKALTDESGTVVSISEAESTVFTEHTPIADAEEVTSIRSEVDKAAVSDNDALISKLNHITDQAGLNSDDLAIAEHLKSWLAGHEISRNLNVRRGRKIGKGGFGEVYRSNWHSQPIAEKWFKVPFKADGNAQREAQQELDKEAKAMRELRHPNVVKLVAKDDANCTLLLELMAGSLTELIKQATVENDCRKMAPFPDILVTVEILLQISKGMLFLHDNRMAHRDIKSGNILYLVREPGGYIRVKVADFGLARPKTESAIAITADRGTLQWTAPELFVKRRGQVVDFGKKVVVEVKHALRADVYSFGITCFEVLTGEINPYGSQFAATKLARMVAEDNLRPTIPETHVPPDLADLMQLCWAKNPSDRPTFAYICKFLLDYKASLLTDSPFHYEPWEAGMDPSDKPDPGKPEVVTGSKLFVTAWAIGAMTRLFTSRLKFLTGSRLSAMALAVGAVKWLFITRFKPLEEITDKDVRSRQMSSEMLGAATSGRALHNMRPVKLSRGDQVMVTRINAQSEQVFLKGAFFLTQLEEHPNLPKIIGYSVHNDDFYLVHKPDSVKVLGSLHEVMSLSADGNWRLRRRLTWEQRYKIALGVGQALAYLHELSTPIVHGNLSSRNIMLEEGNYNPRLFNFYVASMFPGPADRSNFLVNDTRGWDAPEKDALHGDKAALDQDIFSFGVLLLVLVAGRDAFTASKMKLYVHIVDEAWKYFKEGRLFDLEDRQVNGPRDEVFRVLKLALYCVQKDAHRRPTMTEAVDLLLGKAELKVNTLHSLRRSSLTPVRVKGACSSNSRKLASSRNDHASDLSAKVARQVEAAI